MSDTLYEQDFFRWTEQQADALRALAASGANLPLDWENLAEEIGSLGRRDRFELSSRIATIIEHLLELEYSPAARPRRAWRNTVRRERDRIERQLEDSPGLRRHVPELVEREGRRRARLVSRELEELGGNVRSRAREVGGRPATPNKRFSAIGSPSRANPAFLAGEESRSGRR